MVYEQLRGAYRNHWIRSHGNAALGCTDDPKAILVRLRAWSLRNSKLQVLFDDQLQQRVLTWSIRFDVAFPEAECRRFLEAMRMDSSCMLDAIAHVNSMKSDCSRAKDRLEIMAGIEKNVGFTKLDRMVFEVLGKWLLQTLKTHVSLCERRQEEVATWYISLGRLHCEQGRLLDAEDCFNKASAAALHDGGPLDSLFLMAQMNLAVVRYNLACSNPGVWSVSDAHALLAEIVATCRLSLPQNNVLRCTSLSHLADMHRDFRDINKAKDLYHEALHGMSSSDNSSDIQCTIIKIGLASLAQDALLHSEACFMFADAYRNLRDSVGQDHPVAISCRMRHALCLMEQPELSLNFSPSDDGSFDHNSQNSREIIEPSYVPSNFVGSNAMTWHMYDSAYVMLADSFERCCRVFGKEHPHTVSAHAWLQLHEGMMRQNPWMQNWFSFFCCAMFLALMFIASAFTSQAIQLRQQYGANIQDISLVIVDSPIQAEIKALSASFNPSSTFSFQGAVVAYGKRRNSSLGDCYSRLFR